MASLPNRRTVIGESRSPNRADRLVDSSPQIDQTKRITFQQTRSFYKALSADVPAKEGLNAHAVLVDELHAQKNRELWDTLRYAGASRRQPLNLAVTTAGFDRLSICWEQHCYAQQVLEGLIEDTATSKQESGCQHHDPR